MTALSASRVSLWVSPVAALLPSAADAAVQYTASGVDLWSAASVAVPVNFSGAGTKVVVEGWRSGSYLNAFLTNTTSSFRHLEDTNLPGASFSDGDPNALPAGITVGPAAGFDSQHSETLVSLYSTTSVTDGNFGYFPGQERYLGVTFQHAGNTHYGWIGFLFTGGFSPSFVITGWAWDDTPGTPILTGDMGLVSADSPSGGGAGAAAAAAAANTQNNVRLQQQQQAAAARVARQKVAQQHRRNQQR